MLCGAFVFAGANHNSQIKSQPEHDYGICVVHYTITATNLLTGETIQVNKSHTMSASSLGDCRSKGSAYVKNLNKQLNEGGNCDCDYDPYD